MYEMVNLKKAFPKGQESNPAIPNLGNHDLFSPLLDGFHLHFFYAYYVLGLTISLKRMLKKDNNERFDSRVLKKKLRVTTFYHIYFIKVKY